MVIRWGCVKMYNVFKNFLFVIYVLYSTVLLVTTIQCMPIISVIPKGFMLEIYVFDTWSHSFTTVFSFWIFTFEFGCVID